MGEIMATEAGISDAREARPPVSVWLWLLGVRVNNHQAKS